VIRCHLPHVGILIALTACSVDSRQETLFREQFDAIDPALPPAWRILRGVWRVENGAVIADSLDGEGYVMVGDPAWENYEIQVTATFLRVKNPSRWLAVLFRGAPDGVPPWSQFTIRQKTDVRNGLEFAARVAGGRWDVRAVARGAAPLPLGEPHGLSVRVAGESVTCTLDGKTVVESFLCVDRSRGVVGLGVSGSVVRFDDFLVRPLADAPWLFPPSIRRSPFSRWGRISSMNASTASPARTIIMTLRGVSSMLTISFTE